MVWHNQAYIAAAASLGVLLGITKVWLGTQQKTVTGLAAFEVGILGFTTLAYLYLAAAHRNYKGNEEVKVKCERALRLKDEGSYFETGRFFWASEGNDDGMPARDIPILKYGTPVAGLALGVACLVSYWAPFLPI